MRVYSGMHPCRNFSVSRDRLKVIFLMITESGNLFKRDICEEMP